MILSAHQPAYIPWLGYFDKINKCDLFIYLDTVQFEKNSFINRNKIKTPQGETWLSIPILTKEHTKSNLLKTRIDNTQKWQKKHLNSIFLNYKKAKFFDNVYNKIEPFYNTKYDLLANYCYDYLLVWLNHFDIKTKIIKSSTLDISSKKSDLVYDLCKKFNANDYLSGALGKNYLEEKKFFNNNINIEYQNYIPQKYEQLWGEFIPYLGIIDFAMNERTLK